MGCLFALLGALSSFTVVLMPRGNLSHGGRALRWARKTKGSGSQAASCTLFAHLSVGLCAQGRAFVGILLANCVCVCVLGERRWTSCIHFCLNRFHAAFVQKRCKVDQSEKGFPLWGGSPALNCHALQSCIKRQRREGNVQRVKTSGLISGAVT